MTTQGEFIGTICEALGREKPLATPERPPFRHSVHTDVMKDFSQEDLARMFIDCGETIGVSVFETTRAELNEAIRTAVKECGFGPILLANDDLLNDLQTAEALKTDRTVQSWDTGESREYNVGFAEKAAVGIAVAKMALAESATVLLFSQAGCGRSVTLLPESVIYVVPKSRIRPRLTQGMMYLRGCKENLPSSVNFVSGPSATSDIELIRVVGVHGPVHVTHIVVNDM